LKKRAVKTCSWCGTKLRNGRCPRGPACREEQQNHDSLMARIDAAAKAKA
jgi:hypothetical protein